MFVRVSLSRRADMSLRYHERKVAKGEARLIHSKNFLHPTDRLAYPDMQWRFRALNELNPRTKVNMVNVILSFPEGHVPSEDKMAAISDRYMKAMDLGDQPYLVYRHDDTRHPHLHILGNLIDADGKRAEIYLNVMQRKERVKEELSREFNLISIKKGREEQERPADVEKLIYGKANLGQEMAKIVEVVMKEYNFTCIEEYNAILREYNVWARWVQSEQRGNRVALVYQAVHENGNKIGKPLPASHFEFKPTWKRLEGCFVENALVREDACSDLGNRLNWVLFRQPEGVAEQCGKLRKRRIEALVVPGKGGDPNELVLVDHHSRIAVKASDLEIDHDMRKLREEMNGLMVARSQGSAIPQNLTELLEKEKVSPQIALKEHLDIEPVHKIRRHV
jgi:hypothetical protein